MIISDGERRVTDGQSVQQNLWKRKRRTETGVGVPLNMNIPALVIVVAIMMITTLTMIVTFGEEQETEYIAYTSYFYH